MPYSSGSDDFCMSSEYYFLAFSLPQKTLPKDEYLMFNCFHAWIQVNFFLFDTPFVWGFESILLVGELGLEFVVAYPQHIIGFKFSKVTRV